MSNLTNPDLISTLACPDCAGALVESSDHLSCSSCGTQYRVVDGIPLLYSKHMDFEHMHEEEHLAGMMKSPRLNSKERFSATQWDRSKEEFWSTVQKGIAPAP